MLTMLHGFPMVMQARSLVRIDPATALEEAKNALDVQRSQTSAAQLFAVAESMDQDEEGAAEIRRQAEQQDAKERKGAWVSSFLGSSLHRSPKLFHPPVHLGCAGARSIIVRCVLCSTDERALCGCWWGCVCWLWVYVCRVVCLGLVVGWFGVMLLRA